jgi:mannose-1-phosphate guanylyltransferase
VLSETSGSVVAVENGRLVALLGLQDVIVIDTPDALLVCARDRAQDVKKLVDELKARGATEYL